MRSFGLFLVFLLVFGAMGSALAADLNAPVEKKKPTVMSEIQRGYDALYSPIYKSYNFKDEFEEINGIMNINKQQNTDTDPFLLGFYFAAWDSLRMSVDFEMKYNNPRGPGKLKLFKEKMVIYLKEFRRLQKDLKIDDNTFFNVVGIDKKPKELEIIIKQMQETESQSG